VVLAVSLSGVGVLHADSSIPRITKEELKTKLDDPMVVILDVRRGTDWNASEFKIPGATFVGKGDYGEWSTEFDKDKTLVLYCA
jgi:rhodanese-related sulfurtransferase